jgi:hypothetical protein
LTSALAWQSPAATRRVACSWPGAGKAIHEASGVSPSEVWRSVVDAYLVPAREELGSDAAHAADAAGRKLSYEEAIDFALDSLGPLID